MNALLLSLSLVLGSDALSPTSLQGLSFKAPASWVKEVPDDNTFEWASPDDNAKLALSVYSNEKLQPAAGCLKKMLEAVGKEGFENFVIDSMPASKRTVRDFVGEGEEAKTDANRITTTTVLGCNGKTRWLLTWTAKSTEGTRFGPIFKRIIDSISYGK